MTSRTSMAEDGRLHLTALCAVVAFLWVSHTFETHTLNQWPRFSVVVGLLLSSGITWLASLFSRWLPGSDGRFDGGSSILLSDAPFNLPRRPRRYFIPAVVFCIVLRLEVFHQVTASFQCSQPGVESFICTLLVFHEVFFGRKARANDGAQWEPQDPWRTLGDDFLDWLSDTRLGLIGSVLLFNYGVYLAAGQQVQSTYFCSSILDSRAWTVLLQVLGLFLDCAIAVLLWRILTFTKTTKARLRTLGGIQFFVALVVWSVYVLLRLGFSRTSEGLLGLKPDGFTSLGWLYVFDVISDSITFAVLAISSGLVISHSGPLQPLGVITLFSGVLASLRTLSMLPTWQGIPKSRALLPLYIMLIGFGIFMYMGHLRSIFFIRRVFFLVIILALLIGTTVTAILTSQIHDRHPMDNFIYHTRVEADRWLRHASVSNTLRVAVEEYQERHDGRDPPPNFDKWYAYAKSRNSTILDHFQQIEDDIFPFWGLSPEVVRRASHEISAQQPNMAVVTVTDHKASHNYQGDGDLKKSLDSLVKMIQSFSEHLGNMELPINVGDEPRVLTPRSDLDQHRSPTLPGSDSGLLNRRIDEALDIESHTGQNKADEPHGTASMTYQPQAVLEAYFFREMEAQTCPADSSGRTTRHWNVRDFCYSCAARHSKGQFLAKWATYLQRCHQPDMARLHGFHLADKMSVPLQQLVPVFSSHKSEGFNDILIPLPRAADDEVDATLDFQTRINKLHWRGQLGRAFSSNNGGIMRGGQRERLLHLVNNSTSSDEVIMMLPTTKQGTRFRYEAVRAEEASMKLSFDVGLSSLERCTGPGCEYVEAEFGVKGSEGEGGNPLRHRYVLLMDSNTSPPDRLLSTLRSKSVPFVASIFRQWHTERLMPWVHFVPVDTRLHGLHSTLAYFSGVKGLTTSAGREVNVKGRLEDAKWIGNEGRAWAAKVLRREDMEVYLFRLLLEWGRIIDDERDKIGFKMDQVAGATS